jgi:hypothetical protein
MALVLLMEGTNQFVTWRHIIEILNMVFGSITNLSPDASLNELYSALNSTIWQAWDAVPAVSNDTLTEALEALQDFSPESNATEAQMNDSLEKIVLALAKAVFDGYQFEPPNEIEGENPQDTINAYYAVFELVFGYFYICAGVVLIGLAVLSLLSMHKDGSSAHWRRYVGIGTNLLLGLGLALLSTMVLTDNADVLGESPWPLPLLVFVLIIGELLFYVQPHTRY